MTTKFDPTKPVTTRDGRPARIFGVLKGREHVIHGAVEEVPGLETHFIWYADGSYRGNEQSKYDLVNAPKKRTVWRYTVTRLGFPLPHTSYWNTEELAREHLAGWEMVGGATVREPPHPFEYEVPE